MQPNAIVITIDILEHISPSYHQNGNGGTKLYSGSKNYQSLKLWEKFLLLLLCFPTNIYDKFKKQTLSWLFYISSSVFSLRLTSCRISPNGGWEGKSISTVGVLIMLDTVITSRKYRPLYHVSARHDN